MRGAELFRHITHLIYPGLLAIYLLVIERDIFILAFLGILIITYLLKLHRASFLLLNASILYSFAVGDIVIRLAIILYILIYPYLVALNSKLKIYPTGVLGPLTRSSIVTSLIYTPAIVFRPSITLYYMILYMWILILSIYSYLSIRDVGLKEVLIPKNLVLNRLSRIILTLDTNKPIYVYVSTSWGYVVGEEVHGGKSIALEYTPESVGTTHLEIEIYVFNRFLTSCRRLGVIDKDVNISPFTLVNIRYILRGLGEILSRAGLPDVIGLETVSGEGGRGEGVRGRGCGEEGLFKGLLAGIRSEYYSGLGMSRRRSLEYYSVREYYAGDEVRDIHWKKSVSRDELYVKEYSGGGGGGGGSGISLIIIADLLVSNARDLDNITNKILLTLYSQWRSTTYREKEVIVILVSPYNEILYVKGSVEQVLSFYITIFKRGIIRLFYNYNSLERYIDEEYIYNMIQHKTNSQIIKASTDISSLLARRILNILNNIGYGRDSPYTLINSNSSAFTGGLIKWLLSLNGYPYIDIESLVKEVRQPIISG